MKLQTMLLPTGEFVVVVGGASPNSPNGELLNNLKQFRESSGAAGIFITNEEVEVEDALVDENARRADVEYEDVTSGPLTFDESWSFTTADLGPIIDKLDRGIEFTPAGLVNTKQHPEARSTAQLEPELAEALARNPDFCNLGEVKPKIGDIVDIVEVAGGNRAPYLDYIGRRGKITSITTPDHPQPFYFVEIGENDGINAQKVEIVHPDTTSTEQDDCGCYPVGVAGPMCTACPLIAQVAY